MGLYVGCALSKAKILNMLVLSVAINSHTGSAQRCGWRSTPQVLQRKIWHQSGTGTHSFLTRTKFLTPTWTHWHESSVSSAWHCPLTRPLPWRKTTQTIAGHVQQTMPAHAELSYSFLSSPTSEFLLPSSCIFFPVLASTMDRYSEPSWADQPASTSLIAFLNFLRWICKWNQPVVLIFPHWGTLKLH